MINIKYKVRIEFVENFFFKYFLVLYKWLQKYLKYKFFIKKRSKNIITILKSPHVNKKAREQLGLSYKRFIFFFQNFQTLLFFWKFFNFFFFFFTKYSKNIRYRKLGLFYSR